MLGSQNINEPGALRTPRLRSSTQEVPDMRDSTQTTPRRVNRWPVPWRNDPRPAPNWSHANLAFGLPASWEDMVALGLDPYTGEVTG